MAADTEDSGRSGPAGIVGWVLFDWAMQPYFTLVTTFVFAPYFAAKVAGNAVEGQALWGYATALAGIVIALLSPVLGSIADAHGPRKPWVLGFGLLMALGCGVLWFAVPGGHHAIPIALVGYWIGTLGAEFATVFNNAMMPGLVRPERLGRLSGAGWACGYVGGLVSLVLVLGFMAADPETGRTLLGLAPILGLDPATSAGDRASGPLSSLWFIVFVLPMLVFTPDVGRARMSITTAVRGGMAGLRATLASLKGERNLARFLVANMVYSDGLVALFAFGGIYAAGIFGWTTIEIGIFGILLTITGTLGAFIGGWLDDRIGSRAVVIGAILLLTLATLGILSIDPGHVLFVVPVVGPQPGDGLFATLPERLYVAFGALIGIAAGPMQAGSRTLLAHLAPREKIGAYYGLFALSGKVTSFMAPLAVAAVTDIMASQRAGAAVLIGFFVVGLVLLAGVEGKRREG